MKVRDVVIFNGKHFRVPQGIQRIDHRATHGWQLRYGGTKLFSDKTTDGSGAGAALEEATRELLKRIATLPAPSRLQRQPAGNKTSDLPVGVFGPVVRLRRGSKVRDCSFSVLLPQFGDAPRRGTVYIGTENTYSEERRAQALAKALEMRERAEAAYQRAATKAMREKSKVLLEKLMGQGSAKPRAKAAPKTAAKAAPAKKPTRSTSSRAARV